MSHLFKKASVPIFPKPQDAPVIMMVFFTDSSFAEAKAGI